MKIKQEYRIGIGASSMLLVFVVIALVTLGALAYLSARADYTLTEKSIAMAEGYYEASAAAQRRLMVIDNELSAVTSAQELNLFAVEEGMTYEDGTLYFSVDADGDRVLNVAISINERYQYGYISQYTLENKAEWLSEYSEFTLFDEVTHDGFN